MNSSFEHLIEREFLLTNGIGGYASSSFCGANTRRYHGLLVASFNPPTQRKVVVSKLEETILLETEEFELACNQYPSKVHPAGFKFIQDIKVSTNSIEWLYNVNNHIISKRIKTIQGRNTTVVTYTNLSKNKVGIQVRPMLVWRDFHAMFKEDDYFDFYIKKQSDTCLEVFAHYGSSPLHMITDTGKWRTEKYWYKSMEYAIEKERGFDFSEDVMQAGACAALLNPGEQVEIILTTEKPVEALLKRYQSDAISASHQNKFIHDLIQSGSQFIVHRNSTEGSTVMAGYHWFSDWGRDTMIAMRGLTIHTQQQEVSKSILQSFFDYISEGMLPNRFPDYAGEGVEYNTIDASLWLFVAMYDYWKTFHDDAFLQKHIDALLGIIAAHIKGTRYSIQLDKDYLIKGGETGVQLTWMDAKVGDYVVTPRIGKPVEINLLWYNALKITDTFCEAIKIKKPIGLPRMIAGFEKSFGKKFINQAGYLADVVLANDVQDNSLRPNMIYAVSLPFSPVSDAVQKKIVDTVSDALYTALGLRTLDKKNQAFRAIYEGDAYSRDTAYHQGTVWPFLWGEWALAYLKLNKFSKNACATVWEKSKTLQDHFYNQGCAYALSEIYDGLYPLQGKGCAQQAWSIGNLLMVFLHPDFKTAVTND